MALVHLRPGCVRSAIVVVEAGVCIGERVINGLENFVYNTNVAGHPQLSVGRSPNRTPNPDLEGPVSRGVYNIKVVVHGHRDRPMSGYSHIL